MERCKRCVNLLLLLLKAKGNKKLKSFIDFYKKIGEKQLYKYYEYRNNWDGYAGDNRIYYSNFKELKDDFETEVYNISNFLDIETNSEKIKVIKQEISIKNMRKLSEDTNATFYRKGEIGDFKNTIPKRLIKKINKITNMVKKI